MLTEGLGSTLAKGKGAMVARSADAVRRRIHQTLRRFGYDVHPWPPRDLDPEARAIIDAVGPHTMTSPERLSALCEAVKYLCRADVPGAIVECGVWRGGSMMAAAHTLQLHGGSARDLYLFDTFEGMTEPQNDDIRIADSVAASDLLTYRSMSWRRPAQPDARAYAPLDLVMANMAGTGYSMRRIHFVKGPVEQTLPESAPAEIALLRLDTDWYQSTRHELVHLVPRMTDGSVLIVDDYAHWQGCRRAVDEFLQEWPIPILLNRIDDTARIALILQSRIDPR